MEIIYAREFFVSLILSLADWQNDSSCLQAMPYLLKQCFDPTQLLSIKAFPSLESHEKAGQT